MSPLSRRLYSSVGLSFFFNHPATTEIYTLSLHDALPICQGIDPGRRTSRNRVAQPRDPLAVGRGGTDSQRSEEHTSELQSPDHLVCRLLLEKKKKQRCRDLPALSDPDCIRLPVLDLMDVL